MGQELQRVLELLASDSSKDVAVEIIKGDFELAYEVLDYLFVEDNSKEILKASKEAGLRLIELNVYRSFGSRLINETTPHRTWYVKLGTISKTIVSLVSGGQIFDDNKRAMREIVAVVVPESMGSVPLIKFELQPNLQDLYWKLAAIKFAVVSEWWSRLSDLEKTTICNSNLGLIGRVQRVRRIETLKYHQILKL